MKKFVLLSLFFTIKVGLAQSFELRGTDTINYIDANNMRQGFWVITNKIKKLPNCPDEAKIEEGKYVDSKKIGKWLTYHCNGNPKNELTFVNNRPSGYAKFYYENGNLMEEGQWENTRWVGEHKFYYPNGNLQYTWNHNANGKREGTQKYYHENGKIMIEGDWKEGKEAGTIKEYYDDGSVKSEKVYNDGVFDANASKAYEPKQKAGPGSTAPEKKPETTNTTVKEPVKVGTYNPDAGLGVIKDGYNKTFNAQGKPWKEGEFRAGQLYDGKMYMYEGDKVVKTIIFKGGKRVGEEEGKK